jgi:DHA2 family multidrug resistance protein
VIAAMIGSVLEILDTSITNVALPQMEGNLGATMSEVGWVNTGYMISNVIVLPLTGWLSLRYGQRKFFACSIALFTFASIMCGASHSLGELVFWRIIQGLGGGGLLSTGQVIVMQAFPEAQQGIAASIYGMGIMIGPTLGPVLGGYLTDNYSWPSIFFINVPFGVAAAVLTWLYVPDGARDTNSHRVGIDWSGFLLLAIGMGALQTVLEKGQEDDWFSSNFIIGMAVTAAVGLIAFTWWELRNNHPIVDLRTLRSRPLIAGCLLTGVVGFGLYGTLFLLPMYLQQSQGFTAYQTGMTLLPSAFVSMLSFIIIGPLCRKADARLLVAIGMISFVVGAIGMMGLTTQSAYGDLFWPLVARGASLGFLFVPLTVASLAALAPDRQGTGSGFVNLSRQLGGSIGIAVISTFLTRRADFHRQVLDQHINSASFLTEQWLGRACALLTQHAFGPVHARMGALTELALIIEKQATMLAFNDSYLMVAIAFLATLPLLLLFRPGTANSMTAIH